MAPIVLVLVVLPLLQSWASPISLADNAIPPASDMFDLEQICMEAQAFILPIVPPGDTPFLQLAIPCTVPFSWNGFDEEFNGELAGSWAYGQAVYEILMMEDPVTRELVFFNRDGNEIFALERSADYNPHAFAEKKYPDLYTPAYSEGDRTAILRQYDPARIEVEVRLVKSEDFAAYILAETSAFESTAAVLEAGPESGGAMMGMESTSDLKFSDLQGRTNGVQLTLTHADTDAGKVTELFIHDAVPGKSEFDGINSAWILADTNIVLVTGTETIYLDTSVSASVSNRYYGIGKAWVDDDGDALNNAREILLWRTSTDNVDSDGDGLVDGPGGVVSTNDYPPGIDLDEDGFVDGEMDYGTDPAKADTDGDTVSDGAEVVAGTNPTLDERDVFPGTVWVDVGAGDLGAGTFCIHFNATALSVTSVEPAGTLPANEYCVGQSNRYTSGVCTTAYYQAYSTNNPSGHVPALTIYFSKVGPSGTPTQVSVDGIQIVDAPTAGSVAGASPWIEGTPSTIPSD